MGKESTCDAGDMVRSLGLEDPLEVGLATHSTILVCRIPWTQDPGGLPSTGSQKSDMTEATESAHTTLFTRQLPYHTLFNN